MNTSQRWYSTAHLQMMGLDELCWYDMQQAERTIDVQWGMSSECKEQRAGKVS